MRSPRHAILFLIYFLLNACGSENPHFVDLNDKVAMRILRFDDEGAPVGEDDVVSFRVHWYDGLGRIHGIAEEQVFFMSEISSDWNRVFQKLAVGDSLALKIRSQSMMEECGLPFLTGEECIAYISVDHVMLEEDYRSEQVSLLEERRGLEDAQMTSFINSRFDSSAFEQFGRVWASWRQTGLPQSDEEYAIHYRGYFLDGRLFDDAALDGILFKPGMQSQLVPALERFASRLMPRDTIRVVMPSEDAFGWDGTPGIVPPWTPLYYEMWR